VAVPDQAYPETAGEPGLDRVVVTAGLDDSAGSPAVVAEEWVALVGAVSGLDLGRFPQSSILTSGRSRHYNGEHYTLNIRQSPDFLD